MTSVSPESKKLTILLAEDEPDLQEVVKEHLSFFFGRVIVARDGTEALKQLEAEKIDLLLTDIQMHPMDGIDLVVTLRERGIDFPIIMMTAYSDESKLMQAIEAGVNHYLKKPIDKRQLYSSLNNCIEEIGAKNARREQEKMQLQKAIMQSKAELLKDIAHHWRNPLSVIHGMLEMVVLDLEDDEGSREELIATVKGGIQQSQERVQELSRSISIFADMMSRTGGAKSVLNLKQILQDCTVIHADSDESACAISVKGDDSCEVYGSQSDFCTVSYNVIRNALESMENLQDKQLEITVERHDSRASVTYQDWGEGFTEEMLKKACEPYTSTRHIHSGSGMGLFLSRQMVADGLEGELEWGNNDKGAYVRLNLPLYSGD